jgi:urease accessory protein
LGILQSDLLIINKTDLAPYVRVDLPRMIAEANEVRRGKPVLLTNCATGDGVDEVIDHLSSTVLFDR